MTTTKKPDPAPDDSVSEDVEAAEKANAAVQAAADDAEAKGYIGHSPYPDAGKDHSLLTGPDAPPLIADAYTRFDQPVLPAPKKEA